MVSAWASEIRLVLGPIKTDDKSNEITAIPELIKPLAFDIDWLPGKHLWAGIKTIAMARSRLPD